MHRLITRGIVAALLATFFLMSTGCKTQTSKSGSGMPTPTSSPSSSPSSMPTSSPSVPSSQSGKNSSTSSQSDSTSSSSGERTADNGKNAQEQGQSGSDAGQSGSDSSGGDPELAEVGEAVAGAADAVSRAAVAMARAREKIAERDKDENGESASDESEEQADASASSSDEPNYDPFAEPTAGGSADPLAQAAAAVARAAISVKDAQEALEAESAASAEATAQQKQSRAERRAANDQRKRERRASDDLKSGSERLENVSADLDPDVRAAPDGGEEPQDAREALTKAAADLMAARNALITAAVELGYIPEDAADANDDSMLVFTDMEAMVEFLEMSVEVLASVIEQGGLPDFNSPEYENARDVLARRSDAPNLPTGSRSTRREVGELEGELDRTLADFDGELSDERQAMRRGDGQVSGGNEGYDSAGATSQGGTGSVAMGQGDPANETGTQSAARSSGGDEDSNGMRGTGNNAPVDPGDLPDPQGDDVVARQLREAAQAEADPVLRARLWEEYRNYRNATGN